MKQQFSVIVVILAGVLASGGCASSRPEPLPLQSTSAAEAPRPSQSPSREAQAQPAASPVPVLAAPAPQAPSTVAQPPVAHLNGQPIPIERLNKALLEGYGLNMLVLLVQLDYTKQEAARQNIVVTPDDVAREKDLTFAKQFPDADKAEYPLLFDQLLKNTHTSEVEWNILFETNAYIRRMIEPTAKAAITDANLELAFRQLYGETVQVRHIEVGNLVKVAEVKRRLAAGEPFEKVAMELSENARTAPLGGELPPFSRAASYEQVFKDAAFALKEGEVSDAVQVSGTYQIIKLEHRIPPKGVKFEDVKDSIREDLTARYVQANMEQRRQELRDTALRGLIIDNPILKAQYDAQVQKRNEQITDQNQIRQQWLRERNRILQGSSTQPATQPAPQPILQVPVSSAPEVARPPATQSGAQ